MRAGGNRISSERGIMMSDTELIVAATVLLVCYFGLTYRFRISAEENRLRALAFAKELSLSAQTPDSIRKFIANKDVLGARSVAPWIVAATLPFVAIAAAFSLRDDRMLAEVERAGPEIDRLFTGYLDCSAKSSVLRSPIAFLVVALELALVATLFAIGHLFLTNLKGGVKSVLTYFYIRVDDYDLHGFAGLKFR